MGLIRATGRMSRNFSLIRLASIILFIPILFYLIYYTSSSSKTSFNSFKHPVFQEKDLTISSTLTDKIDLSSTKLRIMSVIGTRPETIKMFPVIKQLEKRQGVSSFVLGKYLRSSI